MTVNVVVEESRQYIQNEQVYRGEVWWAYLPPAAGSVQNGKRPVIHLQNDVGNRFSPTVIVAVVSSSKTKKDLPTHVKIDPTKFCLPKESEAFLEQILTIDKWCLESKIGKLDSSMMSEVETAMLKSLGVIPLF